MDDDDEFFQLLETSDLSELERSSFSTSIIDPVPNIPEITVPSEFGFPFTPYSIQSDFMRQLFKTVDSRRVGIFESPTGTGKSLSLICGALTWLRLEEENRRSQFEALTKDQNVDADDDDWIKAFVDKEANLDKNRDFIELHQKLEKREKDLSQWKSDYGIVKTEFGKRKWTYGTAKLTLMKEESDDEDAAETEEDSFILDDYESDREITKTPADNSEKEEIVDTPKIIYCSRTHSQLAQFLQEIKKTKFANDIRCVTLGSRQNFCINETIKKLGQLSLINDRCLQLQKDRPDSISSKKCKSADSIGKRRKKGCPFYKRDSVMDFSNSLLLNGIRDLEDIVREGKDTKACPYYASRRSIADAHLILAPYQVLLNEQTRNACGLRLKNNVLIIDEAHNLLDTLSSMYSVEIDLRYLNAASLQLNRYLNRFRTRLNAKNLAYTRQLGVILENLVELLKKNKQDAMYTLSDFVFEAGIEDINMFKILRYMEISHISQKLNAYLNKFQQESACEVVANDTNSKSQSSDVVSPFHMVESFLRSLAQPLDDGRVIVSTSNRDKKSITERERPAKLKFVHLNAAIHFKDLCTDARSIILAGGTMEPVSDLIDHLFTPCDIQESSIDRFSCGHVIDDENLLPLILGKGPGGATFNFKSDNRKKDEGMIRDLGRLLIDLTKAVPGGIVCFFQSYDYEAFVAENWTKWGILDEIQKNKKVFREPSKASELNTILEQYGKAVKSRSGAIMLAIVGGKLNEGINFSDDLGRLVIMVGMPFPSMSVELNEKMNALGKVGGNRYYVNLCMKAVNQSIGRVIRHRHDYAVILLLDRGYIGHQDKIAAWIKKLSRVVDSCNICIRKIQEFFVRMNAKY